MKFVVATLSIFLVVGLKSSGFAQARDPIPDSLIVYPTKYVFTVGLLQGGSAIGVDAELRLFDGVGFQIGTGLVGVSTGVNFHFDTDINSSYVTLMYVHQGFGNLFVQSMIGPAYVHRWKNGLSGQFGVGFLSGYSRKWGDVFKNHVPPTVQPMIAFGYCFKN
tara:strand:+ start:4296 stop:4784 length:489 start_codon:yes stop_codon:yes gene_type:complete